MAKFDNSKLLFLEYFSLCFMLISLPTFEAPKNIFLILFVTFATFRQIINLRVWKAWDWVFFAYILSAFLSTIFAGISPGDEWKGFRVLLTFICSGWLISRSNYSKKQIIWLFWIAILSVVPPLFWGLYEFLISHSKSGLQLHSVGHQNHSAIYLSIIFGACSGALISCLPSTNQLKKVLLSILTLFLLGGIIVGESRIALGISFLIFIIFSFVQKDKYFKYHLFFLILLAVVSIGITKPAVIQKQYSNQKNNNILAGRQEIWNTTIEAAKLYPLFGIGIDNRANITEDQIKASVEKHGQIYNPINYDFHFKHAHNFYLTQIAEKGLIGASVVLFFILYWIRTLINSFCTTRNSEYARCLWYGSFSAWLTSFGIGFFNTTFHHEHGILACFFLGLHLAYLNKNTT
ncbi:O-antigen ligase family protein [Candidatus Methylopumilus universalis]|uniref:O-antigen ligase family protein n=1 Tax=Candidatus Methylopumilus universalis TaxID=2588536 RepID=UPI0016718EE8|nr:O-antigen ligase family protein [Candidatus Methylopumilus universalis]